MDDDLQDTGLGGWGWYQLGRWSAEDDAKSRSAARRMATHQQYQLSTDQLVGQNQELQAENALLRERLTVYHENYTRLKEWADRAEAELARLRAAKA